MWLLFFFTQEYSPLEDMNNSREEESLTCDSESSIAADTPGTTVESLLVHSDNKAKKNARNKGMVTLDTRIQAAAAKELSFRPRATRARRNFKNIAEGDELELVKEEKEEPDNKNVEDFKMGEYECSVYFVSAKNMRKNELQAYCETVTKPFTKLTKVQIAFTNTLSTITTKDGYVSFLRKAFATIYYPSLKAQTAKTVRLYIFLFLHLYAF